MRRWVWGSSPLPVYSPREPLSRARGTWVTYYSTSLHDAGQQRCSWEDGHWCLYEPRVFRPKGKKVPGNRRAKGLGSFCSSLVQGKRKCRLSSLFASQLIPILIPYFYLRKNGTSPKYSEKWPDLSHVLNKQFFPETPCKHDTLSNEAKLSWVIVNRHQTKFGFDQSEF